MIVENMTRDELFKELAQDETWIVERVFGLQKKYNKQLRNKNVKHLAVLGRTWYTTPNHNRVYCIIQKYIVDDKGKRSLPSVTSLYEYTDNSGVKRYLYTCFEGLRMKFVLNFSAHAMSRMKERIGKDIFGVFEDICVKNDTTISIAPYTYNGNDDEFYTVIGGDIMAFIKYGDWGPCVTTIIAKEQEKVNQLENHAFLKKHINELANNVADMHTELTKNCKIFKQYCTVKSA
jgi:hypothetical protein